jgi:superfamily II RNA helicase
MIDLNNAYEMEIASHFVHLAICNLAWNKDFISTVEVPYSENEIMYILLYMKLNRFVRQKYNPALDIVELYLIRSGIPTTYLSTIHSWIHSGTFDDNFRWIAEPNYNFQSVYETNIKKTRTKHCTEMFTD